MNPSSETKFIQAIEICQSFAALKYSKTTKTYDAIQLFCEVAKFPPDFLTLRQKYTTEIKAALDALHEYGTSIDNWRVDCEIGFGLKDHCNILSFFLHIPTGKVTRFSGNLATAEVICELISDWQAIDLTPLLESSENVPIA